MLLFLLSCCSDIVLGVTELGRFVFLSFWIDAFRISAIFLSLSFSLLSFRSLSISFRAFSFRFYASVRCVLDAIIRLFVMLMIVSCSFLMWFSFVSILLPLCLSVNVWMSLALIAASRCCFEQVSDVSHRFSYDLYRLEFASVCFMHDLVIRAGN